MKLFYSEARKADGSYYSKSTLNSLRFGLNRHFKATRSFDIINDSGFTDAKKCLALDRKKIIAIIDATFAVVKRKPEKNRLIRDSNPMTSAIPVHRSNQLS